MKEMSRTRESPRKQSSSKFERPVETMLLPGHVFWLNDDKEFATPIDRRLKAGEKVQVPFVFPLDHLSEPIDGLNDPHKTRILGRLHDDHRRHLLFHTDSRRYRHHQIVLKGVGLSDLFRQPQEWYVSGPTYDAESYVRGLCPIQEAAVDKNVSLRLHSFGAHVAIPLGIVSYDRLPYLDGKTGTIKYRDLGALRKHHRRLPPLKFVDKRGKQIATDREADFTEAVCYSRLVLSNVRLDAPEEEIRAEIKRLIPVVQTDDPSVQSETDFLFWLAKRLAKGLGVMAGLGLSNNQEAPRNETLGGEIVDLSACRVGGSPVGEHNVNNMLHKLLQVLNKYPPGFDRLLRRETEKVFKNTKARVANQLLEESGGGGV